MSFYASICERVRDISKPALNYLSIFFSILFYNQMPKETRENCMLRSALNIFGATEKQRKPRISARENSKTSHPILRCIIDRFGFPSRPDATLQCFQLNSKPMAETRKNGVWLFTVCTCAIFVSGDMFMASRPRRPQKPLKLQKLRTNTRSSLQPRSEAASGSDNLTSFHSFAFSFKGLYMQCQFPNKFWTFLIRSTLAPSMVFSAENRKQRENEIGLWGPMRLWPITNFSWERVHFDAKSCTGCPGFPGYLQAVI